jgi:hypothetical protein
VPSAGVGDAIGSWAAKVWTAAGAWTEAAIAVTGERVLWEQVGPAAVQQRLPLEERTQRALKLKETKPLELSTPRGRACGMPSCVPTYLRTYLPT